MISGRKRLLITKMKPTKSLEHVLESPPTFAELVLEVYLKRCAMAHAENGGAHDFRFRAICKLDDTLDHRALGNDEELLRGARVLPFMPIGGGSSA